MRPRRRFPLAVALVALVLVTLGAAAAPGVAGAVPPQAPADETTDEPESEVPAQDIVPEPNSGAAPREAGDRGGALQLAVFGGMVAGIGLIVALAVRESRRRQGARPPRPSSEVGSA